MVKRTKKKFGRRRRTFRGGSAPTKKGKTKKGQSKKGQSKKGQTNKPKKQLNNVLRNEFAQSFVVAADIGSSPTAQGDLLKKTALYREQQEEEEIKEKLSKVTGIKKKTGNKDTLAGALSAGLQEGRRARATAQSFFDTTRSTFSKALQTDIPTTIGALRKRGSELFNNRRGRRRTIRTRTRTRQPPSLKASSSTSTSQSDSTSANELKQQQQEEIAQLQAQLNAKGANKQEANQAMNKLRQEFEAKKAELEKLNAEKTRKELIQKYTPKAIQTFENDQKQLLEKKKQMENEVNKFQSIQEQYYRDLQEHEAKQTQMENLLNQIAKKNREAEEIQLVTSGNMVLCPFCEDGQINNKILDAIPEHMGLVEQFEAERKKLSPQNSSNAEP